MNTKLLFSALAFSWLVLPGLGHDHKSDDAKSKSSKTAEEDCEHCHSHEAPAADLSIPDSSLYQIDSTWTNQDGKTVKWTDGKGSLRVITLGYARCPDVCPRLLGDMQRIEKALSSEEKKQVRFTFVSIDPENDTPAALKELAARYQIAAPNWEFLTGKNEDILELAAVLGVHYDALADGSGFSHSYLITTLNPDGRILNKWGDASKPETETVSIIKKVLSKE